MPLSHEDRESLRAVRLNEPQRRHFGVLLGMLEATLVEIEAMTQPAAHPALQAEDEDVPAAFWGEFPGAARRLRARIRALAEGLGLEGRRISRRRRAQAMLLADVIRIEDSVPRKLRAYGEVDPSVATVLGPELEALHRELSGLVARLQNNPQP